MQWPELQEQVSGAAAGVAGLLRGLPDGEAPSTRVSWSVAEEGAHLVTLARRYRRMLGAPEPFPPSVAGQNAAELASLPERRPAVLADLLADDVADLLAALGDDGDRPVPYFAAEHTAAGMAGILLGELLLHGLDLARAVSRPWPITRDQAVAVTRGVLPVLPWFVDARAVARATGRYHLHVRGGDDWSIVVRDGAAVIDRQRPRRADLHVSVDPMTFVLTSYGLLPSWRAVVRGGVFAWGRKPWLGPRLTGLFVET
jgi:uncharacterized protein (TIGR03083 family)